MLPYFWRNGGKGFSSSEEKVGWDSDTIKNLISTDSILRNIQLNLAGLAEDDDGHLVKAGEPKMNSLGISTVMGILSAISNKNTHLTNYDKHYEIGLIQDLNYKLNRILLKRKSEFEIKDSTELNMIIFYMAIPSIRRGVDESDKSFLRGSFHHGTSIGNAPKKRGLFGFLKK